jgi:single-stranded-DNA-specific exonuclease
MSALEKTEEMDAPFGVMQSMTQRQWRWRVDQHIGQSLAQRFNISDSLAHILAGRGVVPETLEKVLRPSLRDELPEPYLFADMQKGVERIAKAIQAQENIVVFGDYDVDGATSAAVLVRYLSELGAKVSPYIPDLWPLGRSCNRPTRTRRGCYDYR